MNVHLTPDQQAFIREAIANRRFERPEQAIQEALFLWEERERQRLEILAAVDKAESSLASGKGRAISSRDEARQLAEEIRRRGMARLTAGEKDRPLMSRFRLSKEAEALAGRPMALCRASLLMTLPAALIARGAPAVGGATRIYVTACEAFPPKVM